MWCEKHESIGTGPRAFSVFHIDVKTDTKREWPSEVGKLGMEAKRKSSARGGLQGGFSGGGNST